MCAADEVTLVDTVNWANGHAGAAAGALVVVNGCEIIYNLDGSLGAALFALTAGDTAVLAALSYRRALIVT